MKYILFVVLISQYSFAQKANITEKRVYNTKSLLNIKPPVIDGILTDESWEIVDWTSDYVEHTPDENTDPIEQTKFKIVYDNEFIYFAFKCYDKNPKEIVKRLSRRDGFDGDWIEINIDSHYDKRTCFSFSASVAGVKSDGFIADNGSTWEGNWNPIWYLKTNIDEEGWTAEIKIPLSQIKFGNDKLQVWGLQSTRRYFRTEERSLWQRVPLDAPGWVSEFGELHGLIDLIPQKQIEIQPFLTSRLKTYPKEESNPFRTVNDFELNGGLDAKIGVTNDLLLDLTINPDFGQVEADPAVIALDGFQLFFPEQRPFFVENKNIFNYNFADNQDNLFYSRRIGRLPHGFPNASIGAFVSVPDNTTILGAAKFSGKTKNGWSIGILESVTDKEFAKIDQNGIRNEELVEPLTNYFVGRVQKDFNSTNSVIGGIITATNRNLENSELNFLHQSAYTAGIDFLHNWKNRKYYLTSNFVLSNVKGSKEAILATQQGITRLFQRVDASHVSVDTNRTSLTGTGGKIEIGKASIGNWRYNGSLIWRSPELELNDIGFLREADEIRQYAALSHQTLKPFGRFRKIDTEFEQFSSYDFEGNFNKLQYTISTDANFKNNFRVDYSVDYNPINYSNSILQGGPRFRYSEIISNSLTINTDSRKKLRLINTFYQSQGKNNSISVSTFNIGITYQPINAFMISLNPNFTINKNKTQYVSQTNYLNDSRYITANIEQQTLSASIRMDYSINPNLTIQYYGQPFISKGKYNKFNRVINPTAKDLNDRIEVFDANQISLNTLENVYFVDEDKNGITDYKIFNPDFSFVQFRSNLVARWEYIPGSEIFFVWSQGITGNANPNENIFMGLDSQVLSRKPENIFLIKATYRFNL